MSAFQAVRRRFDPCHPLHTSMIQRLLMLALAITLAGPAYSQKRPTPTPVSLVYDTTADRVVSASDADRVISIASMTKLISVMTVLAADQDLNEQLTVVRTRDTSSRIRAGMKISRLDLIALAMISSDNLATRTLIENYPGGYSQGILAMNQLAKRLDADSTTLVEPTGIMAANVSTAQDLAKIARAAAMNPLFAILANQRQAEVSVERVGRTQKIVEWVVGRPTNPFSGQDTDFHMMVAKTGFTRAAGFCLVMAVEYQQRRYVIVTAGHASQQSRKRKADQLVKEITSGQYVFKIADTDNEEIKDK